MSTTPPSNLDYIMEEQLQIMAATLKPATICYYRTQANRFLRYLHRSYPELHSPDQLRRNPHMIGWLRSLTEEHPPLTNRSRRAALMCVRRLLDDLADNGYPIARALILAQDFPPRDLYLPKPVSPEVDRLLDYQLRQTDDLLSNALLLIRATGMRVGECLRLNRDSFRHLGENQWALHVPLGKLHNERWVPMDDDARKIFERILSLTCPTPPNSADPMSFPLLSLVRGKRVSYERIRQALQGAARQAGCPPVRLHQLRHTYATGMLRAGISLPALKEILGHRDIRMTMGYVQVTQKDLQREYHLARQKMASVHSMPQLPTIPPVHIEENSIATICRTLDAVRHQLEMFRRQLNSVSTKRKIPPLARRLTKLRKALADLETA